MSSTVPPVISSHLKKELHGAEFFTLSFGAIIGVGWIVVLGDWLGKAGPLGAILAFLAGGVVTLLIGFCYAELAALLPASGGEVAFTYELFGIRRCYVVGWYLILNYLSTVVFEAASIGWVAETLAPYLRGPALYTVRGDQVHAGSLVLGILGMAVITGVNYWGIKPAARVQSILTYGMILLFVTVVFAGITWGKFAHLEPLLAGATWKAAWSGMLGVFLTTPFWIAGFNTVAQVLEEKAQNTSLELVGRIVVMSIGAATLFYCLIILACSMTMPWQGLLHLNLPAATSFETAFHSPLLSRFVLIMGLLGSITVWNSVFIAATRVLFALGRAQIIAPRFAAIVPATGAPGVAVVFAGCVGCCGVLLGRSAILPMVNLASCCFAIPYFFVCYGVFKVRRRKWISPYRAPCGNVTAIAGAVVSLFIMVFSLYQPYRNAGNRVPLEWWLFLWWSVVGGLLWISARAIRGQLHEEDRRKAILR
jgi:APA family basic amino acid/polyamine antiporter